MPCIELPPIPQPPPLPSGFSIPLPPFPPIPVPGACCQLPIPPIPIPPIPLPPLIFNAAFIAAVNAAMSTFVAYVNALPPGCPTE